MLLQFLFEPRDLFSELLFDGAAAAAASFLVYDGAVLDRLDALRKL